MKNKIKSFVVVLLVLGICAIAFNEIKLRLLDKNKEDTTETTEETIDYSLYYSYSDVEKIVGYLADTESKSQELSRLVDPLNKSQPINVTYIKKIVSTIQVPESVYKSELSGLEDESYVTKEQFDAIYHNIADTGIVKGLGRKVLYVFSISNEEEYSLSDGVQIYSAEEEIPEEYLDKVVDVYLKNDKIFKINGYSDSEAVLNYVWVKSVSDGKCTFLYDGFEKVYNISSVASEGDAIVLEDDGFVANIHISNSGITAVDKISNVTEARVIDIIDEGIKIESEGKSKFTCSDNFKIYDIYEEPVCENSLPILKGYESVKLYSENGLLVAAVIDQELVCDDIRVILSNDSYTSYDMESVTVTCNSAFSVDYPDKELEEVSDEESDEDSEAVDENIVEYAAGEEVTITYSDYVSGDIIKIEPAEHYGRLQILSINRAYGNPEYHGILEIDILDETMHVINELPLEKYLYSVVGSEMPSTSPEEALKSMAICARGYAYSKMNDGSFEAYNAHLDDSSLCQVYNNIQETEETIKAVKDTYGLVPVYKDEVIVPLYFSTSCGTTCTNEEIWGGAAYPYLESNVENVEKNRIDLSEEENFIKFIDDSYGYNIIDKDMPYYRWYIDFTTEDMTEAVNSMLEERISMSSDNIQIINDDGSYGSGEIEDIGTIEDIKVTARSKSGVVMTLEITGSEATIEVSGQTNIRNLITPVNQEIIRQDESVVTGWTSLPSPYYYVEKTADGFTIYGGGFGHGSGMSQNGACELARMGHNYKYILRHYYSYIDFASIYDIESEEDTEELSEAESEE